MKTINLNGKMLLVPMSKIGEEFTTLIEQVDGMQNVLGADIFVYATGNMPERHCCCGGKGHHHEGEEGEHHCCGGHHHEGEEGEHHCCGGKGHHHESEEGEHHCCGGHHHEGEEGEHHCCGGHHHEGEEGEHHCCGGHHHEGEEGEHHCCGGHHHEGESYIDDDDLSDEDYAGEDEGEDLDTLLVVDEPLVMINTQQAYMLGIEVRKDMFYHVPEEGLTLLPAACLDREGFITTGPITIRMEE
ncbi:MAG: hypothetical protein J6C80_00320 [Flavobacteriales bacterium]|nr:hypothetical protein [Flavobacteriales bacterium]